MANLLVIGFDSAVLRNPSATADESDPDAAPRKRKPGAGWKRSRSLGGDEPTIEVEHFLHVLFGTVVGFDATASGRTHLRDQIGAVKQESDRMSELFPIAVGIEKAGDSMLDQFAPRAKVRGDDGSSTSVRLQNRFAQSFIRVRWKHGK